MNQIKQHIAFKIATLLVAACLLTPIVVKFTHILSDHEHEVCIGENQSHFHEIDMDCEFYKFNINHQTTFTTFEFVSFELINYKENIVSHYTFLSSYQKLPFVLRGPPINS